VPGLVAAQERPVILVVQKSTAKEFGEDAIDLPMLDNMRQELAEDGRLAVVAWQRKDRTFVEATSAIPLPDPPTEGVIFEVGRRVRARYTLVIEATRYKGLVYPRADLFQSGRRGALWTTGPRRSAAGNSQVIKVGEDIDWQATAQSLARTWMIQLSQGPLRSIGLGDTTLPNPLASRQEDIRPRPDLTAAAGPEALSTTEDLVRRGQVGAAIIYLKDAVDANPFEPERRVRLMELLNLQGLPAEAAQEGRRAARLTADRTDLWLVSAKSWLLAGRPEEAKVDVNEALARGADGPFSRRLLGDIALIRGDLARARDEYSLSLEQSDTTRTRLGLAISFSLIGQPDLARAILTKEPAVAGELAPGDYAFLVEMLGPVTSTITQSISALGPAARRAPKDPAVVAEAERMERQSLALQELLVLVSPPAAHKRSHDSRVLAHKLMYQASQEVLSFAKGGDPEAGLEIVLSLGEALRQFMIASDAYRAETEPEQS
jgi:tetratricopeptide (TPR) repeat protein